MEVTIEFTEDEKIGIQYNKMVAVKGGMETVKVNAVINKNKFKRFCDKINKESDTDLAEVMKRVRKALKLSEEESYHYYRLWRVRNSLNL